MDNSDVERFLIALAIVEIAAVVWSTLLVMLLMRPRNRVEFGTVCKEVAFAIIMVGSVYRLATGELLPVWFAILTWVSAAILCDIYLWYFWGQWFGPLFRAGWQLCRDWWPVVIIVGAIAAVVALIALT